jgi:hypothetical protein
MAVTADLTLPQGALLELAPELVELILCYLGPWDLASFGRTCKRAHQYILPSNQILWRSAFLQIFDDPAKAWKTLCPTARAGNRQRESTWDWFDETRRRFAASNAVRQRSNADMPLNPEHVITTLLDVMQTSSHSESTDAGLGVSLNLDYLDRIFRTAPDPEKFVHDYHRDLDTVSLPLDLITDSDRPITRSMLRRQGKVVPEWASRFHVIYGMTQREEDSIQAKASARAMVYDWTVTSANADFGPFAKDKSGAVNWQTLEAITSLMHRIFEQLRKSHHFDIPSGFINNIPGALPMDPVFQYDWAGINRTWVGTYAFLDYRALVHYNFANHLEYQMDLGSYEEACGDLMKLELEINDEEELKRDHRLQTDLPYCKDLPKLYFKGASSRGPIGRPYIMVRGCVCLVPGGREVRWRFIIR